MTEAAGRKRARGGGGAARRAERTTVKIETAKYIERNIPNFEVLTEEALEVQPKVIAAACPFCNTMMTDGVKAKHAEDNVQVLDVAEMIANAEDL